MKKFYFVLLLMAVCVTQLQAQNVATPNPGFESWTQVGNHFDPNDWNTLNPSTYILGIFTCTPATGANVHSGAGAIKLTTKLVFGIKANGIATTANLITTPPYGVTGGIPYTERPDSIVGWYKYTPASAADSGFMELVLLDAGNDTVGHARFVTPNSAVNTYTRFSKAVTYYSTSNPVLSYWILTSSDGVNPVVNSTLFVDDLDLIFNSSGTIEPAHSISLQVMNSIVTDDLFIRNANSSQAGIRIIDSSGRLVVNTGVPVGENQMDLSSLPAGIYFYQLSNKEQVLNGKLIRP